MDSWSERVVTMPRGRHTLPEDFVSAHQLQRIYAATTELVAKRGYSGTSLDLITKTARVAHSTFYENFDSKQDCFLATYDAAIAEAAEYVSEAVDPAEPWPDQITAGLIASLEFMVANPAKARMCLVDAQGAGPALLDRYQRTLDALVPKLREGRKLAASPFAERTEDSILAGLVWVLHRRLVDGSLDQIEALVPELLQVALRPYLGPEKAARLARAAPSLQPLSASANP